jgi:DNA helicase-2/ATP-dependent DNA helicase PcrA
LASFPHHHAQDVVELDGVLRDYTLEAGEKQLLEERRVAYVALTRAKNRLLLTGAWLAKNGTIPREPSLFLQELTTDLPSGVMVGPQWAPLPDLESSPVLASDMGTTDSVSSQPGDGVPSTANPVPAAVWPPAQPLAERADQVLEAAQAVAVAREHWGPLTATQVRGKLASLDSELALEALVLLEESASEQVWKVALPAQTSATTLIRLAQDPVEQAFRLRRPMPVKPSRGATVGEAFHRRAALELAHQAQAAGRQGMLEDVSLEVGAVDAALDAAASRLLDKFLESQWFTEDYRLCSVETPVELEFMGHAVKARIDAVFEDKSGNLVVVDWKTGKSLDGEKPHPQHAEQVRLYQTALARAQGKPLDQIKAYVHYVGENLSVEVTETTDYFTRLETELAPLKHQNPDQ